MPFCVPRVAVPLFAIGNRQAAYVLRRFALVACVHYIRRYQITGIPMVPTMLVAVLMSSSTQKKNLQSLRSVWIGLAFAYLDVEGLPGSSASKRARDADLGLVPGMSSKLVAEDGSVITDEHCEGELLVKGASMMNGHFKDPVATTATIDQDGWLRAEDVASRVKVKWYIVDRKNVVMGESVIQSEWTYGADRSDRSSSNSMGGGGSFHAFASDIPRTASGKLQKFKPKGDIFENEKYHGRGPGSIEMGFGIGICTSGLANGDGHETNGQMVFKI
ncbi:MAG: hypothetical protein Q9185_001100 [Variospora sp. 1 TL-2023]